jgi:hypothetical protein
VVIQTVYHHFQFIHSLKSDAGIAYIDRRKEESTMNDREIIQFFRDLVDSRPLGTARTLLICAAIVVAALMLPLAVVILPGVPTLGHHADQADGEQRKRVYHQCVVTGETGCWDKANH